MIDKLFKVKDALFRVRYKSWIAHNPDGETYRIIVRSRRGPLGIFGRDIEETTYPLVKSPDRRIGDAHERDWRDLNAS